MLIKILCNKLLLGRATSQLASCTEPSRAGSLFSRARKTGSTRARSERRAGLSRAELLRARASSSSSSFFSSPTQKYLSSISLHVLVHTSDRFLDRSESAQFAHNKRDIRSGCTNKVHEGTNNLGVP